MSEAIASDKSNVLGEGAAASAPQGPPEQPPRVYSQQTASLRWLGEDFVEALLDGLSGLWKGQWHVRLAGGVLASRQHFASSIEEMSCCYSLSGTAINTADAPAVAAQPIVVEITPAVAFPILNCLLGGSSDDVFIPRRPLTTIERRVLQRVVDLVAGSLRKAWPDATQNFTVCPELPTLDPAAAGEMALSVSMELGLDGQAGMLRLCLGRLMLPPMSSPLPAGQKESLLEVTAALAEMTISPADLAALAAGDILMSDCNVDGEVIIRVAGIPKFAGRLGLCDGRRAVTIIRRLG